MILLVRARGALAMKETINVMSSKFGKINPTSVTEYIELGGFDGLKKAVLMQPVYIIGEVKKGEKSR